MATAPLITRVPKMSTENVRFKDGMIVTAEDLTVATEYPLKLMQVLVRAYFGCGVVCGLALDQDSRIGRRTPGAPDCPPENATYTAEIASGVALDCAGYPLEVCGPVRVDLTPDPCVHPGPIVGSETRTLHIAIRRSRKADSAGQQGGCGCDCSEGGGCGDRESQCSRLRDHVEIGVFEELPDDTCRRAEEKPILGPSGATAVRDPAGGLRDPASGVIVEEPKSPTLCECLIQCPDLRHCCGENWVALGTVTIDKWGIVEKGVGHDTRRYVKPVECVCTRKEKEQAKPSAWQPDPAYGVKLEEFRKEYQLLIGQLRDRAEAAEKRAEAAEKRAEAAQKGADRTQETLDDRVREFGEVRTRIDRIEAQLKRRTRVPAEPAPSKTATPAETAAANLAKGGTTDGPEIP